MDWALVVESRHVGDERSPAAPASKGSPTSALSPSSVYSVVDVQENWDRRLKPCRLQSQSQTSRIGTDPHLKGNCSLSKSRTLQLALEF
jgi:hypothetical protein